MALIPEEAFTELITRFGLTRVERDRGGYRAIIDSILTSIEELPELPEATTAQASNVRRATPKDDPLNGIVHWCQAEPTSEGILSGMTLTVKDSIAVAGVPQSAGYAALTRNVPSEHSTVVTRLLEAGATVSATTNMDAFGMAATGESSTFGLTLNPADPSKAPGGSSSGSVASLVYEGVDASLGTDQGGSIRIPASWSGFLGIKPTFGLVPYTGIAGIDQNVDHVGPIARDARTLAAVLQAIAGYDPGDARQRPFEPVDYLSTLDQYAETLSGVRVGVLSEGFFTSTPEERMTADAVRGVGDQLRSIGAEVEDISLPIHLQTGAIGLALFQEGMASVLRDFGQNYGSSGQYNPEFVVAMKETLDTSINEMSPQMIVALLVGTYLHDAYGGERYARARRLQQQVKVAYDAALESYDLLLLPTTPYAATPPSEGLSIDTQVNSSWGTLPNTAPFNVSGHPAISLPLAEANGLPVGAMFVTRHFNDSLLLQLAYACERHFGWTAMPPRL